MLHGRFRKPLVSIIATPAVASWVDLGEGLQAGLSWVLLAAGLWSPTDLSSRSACFSKQQASHHGS